MKIRLAALAAAIFLTGCATSANIADGIRVDLNAGPQSVGVGLDVNPIGAICSFARAVNWDWAEQDACPEEPAVEEIVPNA